MKSKLLTQKNIILGNKNHLINVFTNIIDNAIKYSKDNPVIKIETTNDENVFIQVKDRGIGMNNDTLKMILKNFFANKMVMFITLKVTDWSST